MAYVANYTTHKFPILMGYKVQIFFGQNKDMTIKPQKMIKYFPSEIDQVVIEDRSAWTWMVLPEEEANDGNSLVNCRRLLKSIV